MSPTFDSFSILTRVLENHFKTFVRLFFRLFSFSDIENSVGKLLILNLEWEGLSRLISNTF